MPRGRKAFETDTTPAKVLVLALLATAPVAVAFILMPLVTGGRTDTFLVRGVLFVTPFLAAASLVVYFRAPVERRTHRAARMGALLSGVSLLLWVLVLIPVLRGRV